jgi:hypothetical protein
MDETYEFLVEQQKHFGMRFHKGWELHNGGLAAFRLQRFEEGVEKVFLAYAEDAMSADAGHEDSIDILPAGSTLRALGASDQLLTTIKVVSSRCKEAAAIVFLPDTVLNDAFTEIRVSREQIRGPVVERAREQEERKRRVIEELTTPLERRCFVGGSYHHGGPNIVPIAQIVRDAGFDAIVADDFEVSESDIHHRSLLLLHLCPKAIFEVTAPAGQLMELERCRDYDIKPMLVRNVMSGQGPRVSAMVDTMAGVDVQPYETSEDLRRLINDYLGS